MRASNEPESRLLHIKVLSGKSLVLAASALHEDPVMAANTSSVAQQDDHCPPLQAVAAALGMDPNAKNELLIPDVNFLQELMKLPINFAGMPGGTDVEGMRQWVDEVFANETFTEARKRVSVRRRTPAQEIVKTIVPVKCLGNSPDSFDLWIYQTSIGKADNRPKIRPAMLMSNGGGWIHGNPSGDEPIAELFASELDAVVIGVDYRLAPEHKFPEPLDDCVNALQWVITNAEKYHIDIDRIGLWGASAGGNLAAALAVKYVEMQQGQLLPELRLVSLVVPVTAHPQAFANFEEKRSFPVGPNEALFTDTGPAPLEAVQEFEKLLEMYTGDTDYRNVLVSPLMTAPSPQHPATHVTVAACDYLRPQGQAYAALLRSAGVEVTEDILPGVPHGFTFAMNAEVTKRWLERQVDSFTSAFGRR